MHRTDALLPILHHATDDVPAQSLSRVLNITRNSSASPWTAP
ncbi:hypothetical protein ACIQVN_32680 [Streptomyces cyaneofuscatus]